METASAYPDTGNMMVNHARYAPVVRSQSEETVSMSAESTKWPTQLLASASAPEIMADTTESAQHVLLTSSFSMATVSPVLNMPITTLSRTSACVQEECPWSMEYAKTDALKPTKSTQPNNRNASASTVSAESTESARSALQVPPTQSPSCAPQDAKPMKSFRQESVFADRDWDVMPLDNAQSARQQPAASSSTGTACSVLPTKCPLTTNALAQLDRLLEMVRVSATADPDNSLMPTGCATPVRSTRKPGTTDASALAGTRESTRSANSSAQPTNTCSMTDASLVPSTQCTIPDSDSVCVLLAST